MWTFLVVLCFLVARCTSMSSVSFTAVPTDTLPLDPGVTSGPGLDLSYCQMLLEAPVPPTADQVPWFCMCSTCPSNAGQKGVRGDRGLPGHPGFQGPRGLTGPHGPPGLIGQKGIKGEKGDEGAKGDPGVLGPIGAKGQSGMKGNKGDPGAGGPVGDPGPKGDDGQCPETCESVPGPPGTPGLPGPIGPRGIPGMNGDRGAKGLKGDPGLAGTPGTPGIPGQKGEQGQEGVCNCQNGTKGDTGSTGLKGEKGEEGLSGTPGMSGTTGQKGDQGDMGVPGEPGPCSPSIQSAFSAALSAMFPPPNVPVAFTRVIYNVQQHYDPSTGVYTAPVNGTYVFSYHLATYSRALRVGIFWNFQPVVKSTADTGSTSQQVLLHLSGGDQVWLQVRDSSSNGMYTSSESSSTFSGFLLNPDSCDMMDGRDFNYQQELPKGTFEWGNL